MISAYPYKSGPSAWVDASPWGTKTGMENGQRKAFKTARMIRSRHQAPGVRDEVQAAWDRCHRYFAADPHRLRVQVPDPVKLAAARLANQTLIAAARPHMEAIHQAFGSQPHLIALADPSAYVLLILADEDTAGLGKDAALFEGASWAEQEVGCNGIGTAIAINQPILLVGPEHYMAEYARWTCMGIPFHAPDGTVVGGIDISVPNADLDVSGWDSLLAVAAAVEQDYAALLAQAED